MANGDDGSHLFDLQEVYTAWVSRGGLLAPSLSVSVDGNDYVVSFTPPDNIGSVTASFRAEIFDPQGGTYFG